MLCSYLSMCSVLGCDFKVLWKLEEDDKTEQKEKKQENETSRDHHYRD